MEIYYKIYQTKRAAVAVLGIAALLATTACASGGAPSSGASGGASAPAGEVSAANPFGVTLDSTVDAVAFDGGYGSDYVEFAAQLMQEHLDGVKAEVSAVTEISQELQPRFVGGNPPDLVNNNGTAIPIDSINDQLATLDDLWEATGYDGQPIKDVVFPGVDKAGTINGKFTQLNYVMTVFGMYYSASLLEANGWDVPKTWDDMLKIGEEAKAKGLYLFTFGTEAAAYYSWLLLDSAIKEGGKEVITNIANLKEGAWEDPAVQGVLAKMEECVKNGYFIPGGAGTQFTAAQAQWSNDQKALFYPTGSWIESEMKDATAEGFEMKVAPFPTLTSTPALPYEAIQATAAEPFIVPAQAANVAGGKELLRAMLSKEAAANFSEKHLAPTIVKDTVPADGYGSSALASAMSSMEAAGDNLFKWIGTFDSYYSTYATQYGPAWNSFLAGDLDAAGFTKTMEDIAANIRSDSAVQKITYEY